MPAALTVRGSYRGYSGYDATVRSFVRHLVAAGVRVGLVDFPEWGPGRLPDDRRDPWFDALAAAPVDGSAAVLHFCMPTQVLVAPGRPNVNFTMFEATRVHPAWVARNLRHDLVIVPTESSRRAWLASGFPGGWLRVCPLGVDAERFRPGVPPLDLTDRRGRRVADYAVRVLNVSEVGTRKNLLGLLRVWLRATRADDDAILIVKLHAAAGSLLKFLRDLCFVQRAIGRGREEAASILLLDDVLSDAEMPRLYAAATHYWSMSFGEGWDQPMTEAGAAGLRLIAPDHSAYRAYLDPTVAALIPCRRTPARNPDDPALEALFGGAEWWRPDEDAAGEILARAIAAGGAPGPSGPGARERLATEFTWERATARLIRILDELEADRGR
jgi:glycosyltransferase involved in cell wall biosynthesis